MNLQPFNTYILIPLILWDLVWKGIALWKAARNSQRNWYIALLLVNSLGILPIVYIKFFQKKTESKVVARKASL